MRNRILSALFVVAVLSLSASLLYAGAVPTAKGPGECLVIFNFAPAAARDIEGMIKVSASSAYDKNQGFGWTDLKGAVTTGNFGDPSLPWEGCDNLNVITRPSPDEIGRTFVAGPATFAVDLPNGKYEVWMLVGDTGFLDYLPHEYFSIFAGKEIVFKRDYKPVECSAAYDYVPPDDTITEYQAYDRYVRPRFEWKKADVAVTDGQLKLRMSSPERTADSMKFSPPVNELTLGPAKRFAGSLCALMITSVPPKEDVGLERIDMLEALRRENFRRHFPRVYPPDAPAPKLEKTDTRRGYTLFFPDPAENVGPNTFHPHVEKPIALRACPGEAVPVTFALYAANDLKSIDVSAGYLRAKLENIAPKSFDITQVRFCAQSLEKLPDGGFKWQPAPLQLVPVNDAPLPKGASRQYWLTLTVPEKTKPGSYTGKISITPVGGQSMSLDVALEVLPFPLKHNPALYEYTPYAIPAPEGYFDEKRLWDRVRADLTCIRACGFTKVTLLPIAQENKTGVDKFAGLCKEVGLPVVTTPGLILSHEKIYFGLPNDFFDAGAQHALLFYPGEKFSVVSTLEFERVRCNFDCMALRYTLERAFEQTFESAGDSPARADTSKLLKETADEFHGSTFLKTAHNEEARNKFIDAIIKLLPPPPAPPKKK